MPTPLSHHDRDLIPSSVARLETEIGLVDDRLFEQHTCAGYHPERPERAQAAREGARRSSVQFKLVQSVAADEADLTRVHEEVYLRTLRGWVGKVGRLDPDTYVGSQSVEAAEAAAGSVCELVAQMVGGETPRGLALVRPPGHHARPSAAMGFCLLNTVAIAAAKARALGVERVLIVDWDVHHGNGTQEAFWEDPSVLYASLHQWPFYPGTGAAEEVGVGEGAGFTVNVPLPAGAAHGDYREAWQRIVLPVAHSFQPGLVLVSAGFDAHQRDPLGGMSLDARAFAALTSDLVDVANRYAGGKIALVLEGGYDLTALAQCTELCARTLSSLENVPWENETPARFHREIQDAQRIAGRHFSACR